MVLAGIDGEGFPEEVMGAKGPRTSVSSGLLGWSGDQGHSERVNIHTSLTCILSVGAEGDCTSCYPIHLGEPKASLQVWSQLAFLGRC